MMIRDKLRGAPMWAIVIGGAALAAGFGVTVNSQGIGAQVGPAKSDPARELTALRQQLQALEKRVAELEKGELEESKEDQSGDAREKKLEQRVAQLEKAQEPAKGDGNARDKQGQGNDDAPMTWYAHRSWSRTTRARPSSASTSLRAVVVHASWWATRSARELKSVPTSWAAPPWPFMTRPTLSVPRSSAGRRTLNCNSEARKRLGFT